MARKPVFDVCMLCDEVPCTCKKVVKKAAPKKAVIKVAPPVVVVEEVPDDVSPVAPLSPPPSDVTPAPRPDPRAAMRAAAARARPVTPGASDAAPITRIMSSHVPLPDDYVMADAIRALAPLLDPVERRAHRLVLATTNPVEERAAQWKNRRREVLDNGRSSQAT